MLKFLLHILHKILIVDGVREFKVLGCQMKCMLLNDDDDDDLFQIRTEPIFAHFTHLLSTTIAGIL